MTEITLDLDRTEIQELTLERPNGSNSVIFSVDGDLPEIEDEKIEAIMQAQMIKPVSLTVETK